MSIKGTFYFDPKDRIYKDHFPGRPVVPGSLIVHAFRKAWTEGGSGAAGCAVEDFRFKEFVAPGHYDFSMEPKGEGMRCRLYHEGRVVVSGYIKRT